MVAAFRGEGRAIPLPPFGANHNRTVARPRRPAARQHGLAVSDERRRVGGYFVAGFGAGFGAGAAAGSFAAFSLSVSLSHAAGQAAQQKPIRLPW